MTTVWYHLQREPSTSDTLVLDEDSPTQATPIDPTQATPIDHVNMGMALCVNMVDPSHPLRR